MKRFFIDKKFISFVALFFFILCIQTIAYSAINSTLKIKGNSYARVESDVRITDFSLYRVENAVSSYEDFNKEQIASNVILNSTSSSITYMIEVTNYGSSSVGIDSINGLPSGLSYELIDYNLKDKICNTEGICNNFIKKVFYIKIYGNSGEYFFNLTFDFKSFLNVTYTNISNNNYISDLSYDSDLEVNIGVSNAPGVLVYLDGVETDDYTYKNGIVRVSNVTSNIEIRGINVVKEYADSYNPYSFIVNYPGIYKIELWGAGGKDSGTAYDPPLKPGHGAYTSGNIILNKNDNLFFYVGKSFNTDDEEHPCNTFNGGGSGEAAAGGATDVRLVSGTWNNFDSLESRIMVAAGGGGGFYNQAVTPLASGHAGGLVGYDADSYWDGYTGLSYPTTGYSGYGATQTSGGAHGILNASFDNYMGTGSYYNVANAKGQFGYGGWGSTTGLSYGVSSAGGGGGYYGGGHGIHPGNTWTGGGGGSSFISGHNGCNAIASSSTQNNITHTGQSVHYSGYKFSDTIMIDGAGYKWTNVKGSLVGMPTFDGNSTMTGNSSAGYAKITLVEMIKE